MYFPYLRGRQNELLALRELLELNLISEKVIPVIEPIKNTPTLIKTLQTYVSKKRKILLIKNPKVGSFEGLKDTFKSEYVIDTYFFNNKNRDIVPNNLRQGIILDSPDDLEIYLEKYDNKNEFTFISPDKELEREIRKNRILLADRFRTREKNSDYIEDDDEFFSSDHLFFKDENYIGFSDYSVIGDKFSEGGFAPYAVVIHIVYFSDKKKLRVHHFVSDSNMDSSNTPGKLKEALDKLVEWNSVHKCDTYGIRQFEQMQKNGNYPGLGFIKKLSIMHHIELIDKYLNEIKEK